jgi:hypothetical protein
VASVLITSSITREVNAINFNYNPPNLEKTFEVAEIQSQNFAELNLVDQSFTDIYSVGEPIKYNNPAECVQKLFEQTEICTSLFSGNLIAFGICEAAAIAAYGICMASC